MCGGIEDRSLFWGQTLNRYKQKITDRISNLHWVHKANTLQSLEDGLGRMVDKIVLPSFAFYLHALKDDKKLKGDTPKTRYNYFVQQYHDQFISDLPELKKILEKYLEGAATNIVQCLTRLDENKEEVFSQLNIDGRSTLQKLIIPSTGDRHLAGKQVLFLEFSNGKRIKYKPTDLQINSLIEKVGNFLNHTLNEDIFTFPQGVYYKDYTFLEYKESRLKITDSSKADRLYYQNGCWLAFVYLLNGTDFHVENILAQKSQLYLLDTETFFSNFSYGSGRFVENTLTTTGFIERITKNQPAMSAMFGGSEAYKSITDPYVINNQTDNLEVRFLTTSNFQPENQPEINGARPDFAKNKELVKRGFTDIYKAFCQSIPYIKNIVDSNKNTFVRQVLRKTSLYSLIIQNIYQPHNWPPENYRQEVKSFLEGLNEHIRDVIDFETKDLFRFDVPYFRSRLNERSLYHGDREINDFFSETPQERWKEKLNRMGEYHLKKKTEELDRLLTQKSRQDNITKNE